MHANQGSDIELFFVGFTADGRLCVQSVIVNKLEQFSGIRVGVRYVNSYELFDSELKARGALQSVSAETGIPFVMGAMR